MPETAPTFARFFGSVIGIALVGASIYGVGRLLHRNIGRDDDRRREHGRFIPEWVSGTYLALGLGTLFWFGPGLDATYAAGELAALGILIGLLFGWVHGSMRIRFSPRSSPSTHANVPDDLNPYRPPTVQYTEPTNCSNP